MPDSTLRKGHCSDEAPNGPTADPRIAGNLSQGYSLLV
jgi:hypothetical protein